MNWKVYMACNFNCRIENEGLFMVTGINVHYKSVSISETILECGLIPDVMVVLANIGGTLRSMPQSLADAKYWDAMQ